MTPPRRPFLVTAFVIAALAASGCRDDAAERTRKLHVLARKPSDAHKAKIRGAIGDPDRDVRSAALVVMSSIDPPAARAMALPALDDPDGMVRATAVRVLGAALDEAAARRMARLGRNDPFPQVRTAVLEATGAFDDDEVVAAVVAGLDDPIRQVRQAALRAAPHHPGEIPVERVGQILAEDPDWENRVAAAQALGATNDPAAYAPLEAAAADPNEFVRMTAAREVAGLARAGTPRPGV